MKKRFYKCFIYCLLITIGFSCSERERDNPLDPKSKTKPIITLRIESHDNRIDLKWDKSDIDDITGYNLYRREHPDSIFKIIHHALSTERSYQDFNVNLGYTYSYYITIVGHGTESSPSNFVHITPGHGYNWIADKWGYQIIKTTYDARYKILHYFTDWMPADIAIDPQNNLALITQPVGNKIVILNTDSATVQATFNNNDRNFINKPYMVEYEPQFGYFWICDSSGSLYRISTMDFGIELISNNLRKPIDITLDAHNNIINVIDSHDKSIRRFTYEGTLLENIDYIGNHQITNPKKFIMNSIDDRFWLIDQINNKDYIYTGFFLTQEIFLADSVDNAADLCISPIDQSAWIISQKWAKSTILQLSKEGIRQLELSGFYNPNHLTHNPYDGTLLVADTGNYRLIHYTPGFEILGIYSQLNTPVRIEVE